MKKANVAIAHELALLEMLLPDIDESASSSENCECIDSLWEDVSQVRTNSAADARSVLLSSSPSSKSVGIGNPSNDDDGVCADEPEGRDGDVTGSMRTFARVRESGVGVVLYAGDCMVVLIARPGPAQDKSSKQTSGRVVDSSRMLMMEMMNAVS